MMRATVLFVALGVLAGCGREPDRALRVTVTLKAVGERRVQADCLRLSVLDEANELKSTVIARPTDDVAVFGVLRGSDLPASVRLQVSGYLGTCADEASFKLNAQGDPVAQTFPEEGVKPVELTLEPPGPALDADRDGFVAADKGGVDCRDVGTGAASVFPGAGQLCDVYEDTDCDGAAGCDDSQCAAAPACAAQADRLVISSMPVISEMRRYECVGPFTVTLQNAQGPRSAVRDMMVGLSSSLPGTSLHAQAGCGDAPLSSYPMRFGDTSFEVYLEADAQAFGLTSVRATATGVAMPGAISVQVRPQPIAQLRFGTALAPVTAGTCSTEQVTLELIDAQGRPTAVESPASLTLSANPTVTGGLFFSDAACANATATASLAPGQGVVRLHVSSQRAGDITMSAASSTGQGPVTQVLTVVPAAATRLAFANQSLAVQSTQSCSAGQLEVQLHDAFDNTVTPTAPVAVRMSSTLGDISFHPGTDTACQPATGTIDFTIPAMSSSVRIRVKPGLAATGTVTASAPTLVGIAEAVQNLDVAGGPPARVVLLGQAQSPVAGDCSPAPIELAVRDAAGNPSSFSTNVTANLSVSPAATGTFGFFTASGCGGAGAMTASIPAGQSRVQLFFRGTRAVPDFAINAGVSMPTGITSAMPLPNNAIRPSQPGKLTFVSTTSQTTTSETCSALFNLNVLDVYDNATSYPAPQDVTVTTPDGGVTIGPGVSCYGATPVQLAANTTSVGFAANHRRVGVYPLTATVGSPDAGWISTVTPATLTVTPGAGILAISSPDAGQVTVRAGDCQPVTLVRRDQYGNNAPTTTTIALGLPSTVSAYTAACPGGTTMTGGVSSVALAGSHTVGFNLKPSVVGTRTVTAQSDAGSPALTLNVVPGDPVLQVEAPDAGVGSTSLSFVAGDCVPVTLARKDLFRNDVPLGQDGGVSLSVPANLNVHPGSSCSVDAGQFVPVDATASRAAFALRSIRPMTAQTLQAELGGQQLNLGVTVATDAPELRLPIPLGPGPVTAGACLEGRVERRDRFDNEVPLTTAATLGFDGGIYYASATCSGSPVPSIGMSQGAFQQTFGVRWTQAGAQGLFASLAGQDVSRAFTVVPGPTRALVVQGLPGTLVAGACTPSSLTVRRNDQFGNAVVNEPDLSVGLSSSLLSFSSQGDCAVLAPQASVVIPQGSSTSLAPVFARGTVVGSTSVAADAGVATGAATTFIDAGVASRVAFVSPPSSPTVVAGACSSPMTVRLEDTFGNQVTPSGTTDVALASSADAGVTFTRGTTTCAANDTTVQLTAANPTRSFVMRATRAPDTVDVTASLGSLTPATLSWSVEVGPPTVLAWKTDPPATVTRFTCTAAGVMETRDSAGNPSQVGSSLTVNPVSSAFDAGVLFYTDSTCATPLSAGYTIPGGGTEVTLHVAAGGTGATNLSATSSLGSTSARAVSVSGNAATLAVSSDTLTVEAGACVPVSIERQVGGLPATLGRSQLQLSVPGPTTAVTLHTDASCTGAGATSVSATVGHGESSKTFYVRGRTGGDNAALAVTATAAEVSGGATPVTIAVSALPLVRRGTCDMADTQSERRCALSPAIPSNDISRSFLMFTSTGSPSQAGEIRPMDANVECHLEGGASPVEVVCTRTGNRQAMQIAYQVVSHGRSFANGGLSVQHLPVADTNDATPTDVGISQVDLAQSFVLFSSSGGAGSESNNDGSHFLTARLTSDTNLRLEKAEAGVRRYSAQVVSVAGAVVTRGEVSVTGFTATQGSLTSVNRSRTTMLFSTRGATGTAPEHMCKRRLRGFMSLATAVDFSRGNGTQAECDDDAATVAWERVEWPACGTVNLCATVQHLSVLAATGSNTSQVSPAFTAVDRARSVALMAGQGPGGQSAGESTITGNGNVGDDTGAFHGRIDFTSATTLTVHRAIGGGDTRWSPQVVQFGP